MGIRMHADDFGAGNSFLARLGRSKAGKILFKSIASMRKAFSMRITAERVDTVETEAQLQVLQALGCDDIQGYFISRPLPPDEIIHSIKKRFLISGHIDSVDA